MKRYLINAAIALAVLSACRKKIPELPPCTKCADVSGFYAQQWEAMSQEELAANSANACRNLEVFEGSNLVEVVQDPGSPDLLIDTGWIIDSKFQFQRTMLKGVLHDDLSVTTETLPTFLTDAPVAYQLGLTGTFQMSEGVGAGLDGTLLVSQNCSANIPVTWVRVEAP